MTDPTGPDAAMLDALIAAGTSVLGLEVEPSWQDAIRAHLAVTLRHAAMVGAFALPDEAEPAPVFGA